ncbi:hypothetical protein HMPREF1870_00151 [Bacteroidales bacterium KA00344]|nr:hypothetical protein HMPREF1870_00151 [Bacteroidales bacterium KA00344]
MIFFAQRKNEGAAENGWSRLCQQNFTFSVYGMTLHLARAYPPETAKKGDFPCAANDRASPLGLNRTATTALSSPDYALTAWPIGLNRTVVRAQRRWQWIFSDRKF